MPSVPKLTIPVYLKAAAPESAQNAVRCVSQVLRLRGDHYIHLANGLLGACQLMANQPAAVDRTGKAQSAIH